MLRRRILRRATDINGLLNNLVAYWPQNEVAGNALELHNGVTLTDVNTVTSAAGLVYPLARQYTRATNEYHTETGSAVVKPSADFTFAAWVNPDTVGDQMRIVIFEGTAGSSFLIDYNAFAANRLTFYVTNTLAAANQVASDTFGPLVAGNWHCVICWIAGAEIGIEVNGVSDVAVMAGTVRVAAEPSVLTIGSTPARAWNGRIGPSALWKSAAGLGGALDAEHRAAWYNGGAGLRYDQLNF